MSAEGKGFYRAGSRGQKCGIFRRGHDRDAQTNEVKVVVFPVLQGVPRPPARSSRSRAGARERSLALHPRSSLKVSCLRKGEKEGSGEGGKGGETACGCPNILLPLVPPPPASSERDRSKERTSPHRPRKRSDPFLSFNEKILKKTLKIVDI